MPHALQGLAVVTFFFAVGCSRKPPAIEPAASSTSAAQASGAATTPSALPEPSPPGAASAAPLAQDEDEHLAEARNAALPAGTRAMALQTYARKARDGGYGAEAARHIFALKGQIMSPLGDATYDALGMTGAPSAIPLLLGTGELRRCEGTDVPVQRITPQTLGDPNATIVLDLNAAMMTMATVFALIQHSPDSAEAASAVPDLIQALRCGDERIRLLAGQSIGNVHRLAPAEAEALRELVQKHPRPHTRGLSATLLALSPEPPTPAVLEKTLGDADEFVRLMAAAALVRLHRPDRAVPVLRLLSHSKNQDVAGTAAGVLANP